MIQTIYAAVILIATTLGALVGLGGGVIIKPVLDFIGKEPRLQVDFLSCVSVLTMSVVSTLKQIKGKQKFDKNIVFLISAGSVVGGWLGGYAVQLADNAFGQNTVRCIQALILAFLLVFVCLYIINPLKSFNVKNKALTAIVGLLLGLLASFLGVGGGPINVVVFTLVFSMTAKESAVYSVAVIFFSQITKLIVLLFNNGISSFSHQGLTLAFILPAAVMGGLIGSTLNKKADNKTVRKTFVICMIMIVILNIYNCINYWTIK